MIYYLYYKEDYRNSQYDDNGLGKECIYVFHIVFIGAGFYGLSLGHTSTVSASLIFSLQCHGRHSHRIYSSGHRTRYFYIPSDVHHTAHS